MKLQHAKLTGTKARSTLHPRLWSVFTVALAVVACSGSETPPDAYPAAGLIPKSQPGWEQWLTEPDPAARMDEVQGGRTARGTPVAPRDETSFPAEQRNLFYQMDGVVGPDGQLVPFDFTVDDVIGNVARDAIRGKNTWILWGEGNEAFWGWLQEEGYGLVDFLVLLDSRDRNERFKNTGMINQPGMKARTTRGRLGLYLDEADGDAITLVQPDNDIDQATGQLMRRATIPYTADGFPFVPGDTELYQEVLADLPRDGVDPYVYGYASGVVGLRLWPSPDFFGNTEDAERARAYWNERVVQSSSDAYYNDWSVQADPKLVRPFRVSMSCGFCHVGPHPLSPLKDPENPEWGDLSSTIGNQYWKPAPLFATLVARDNFLYHFLASQQPGTVDTSLVSTDHINNANTINAVFDVPARVERAKRNQREEQSPANLLLPGPDVTPIYTPRVLVDGSDSVGLFGALARVYLNIGTFPEEWERSHNPIIGFRPQRPFSTASLQKNSVFWRIAETQRIPYLARFFTYQNPTTGLNVAPPMKLRHTLEGAAVIAEAAESSARGRVVFVRRCAICHSSKQPGGFDLDFQADWEARNSKLEDDAYALTLPMAFADWERFIESDPYEAYVEKMMSDPNLAGAPVVDGNDPFLENNFLSTDIRVPVTLTGTNAGRALATNAMRGQVWDNFSSETYKNLPEVGPVHFYNPYSNAGMDEWGNNDVFSPPGGGPGWYRPPSLISVWATAPYLHNNALGIYTGDPSVPGRLAAFEDGIGKLLWESNRVPGPNDAEGHLRYSNPELAGSDPGFIYRTTADSALKFSGNFIRPLLSSLLGTFWTSFLTLYVWLVFAVVLGVLAVKGRARHGAFVWLVIGVLLGVTLAVLRLDRVYGAVIWVLPLLPAAVAFWFWFSRERRWLSTTALAVLAVAALVVGFGANAFVSGRFGELSIGPIPKGTPVNLLMNMNPEANPMDLIRGAAALTRGMLIVRHEGLSSEAALEAFKSEAGPALLRVSKNPDFVLDRGHWFGESLTDAEKEDLKAFLLTL